MSSEPLINWVRAREELRKKKESGAPPPWTEDPILNQFRFCNVRRKHDRVSRWLQRNVLTGENLNSSFSQFVLFTALCRWINWPPTIAEIMKRGIYPSSMIRWPGVLKVFEDFKEQKKKSWTGAYMITARGVAPGQTKIGFIVDKAILNGVGVVLPQIETAFHTGFRREVWSVLKTIPNWGAFMAGQVVDDWGWTLLLSSAKDVNTWAPQGPGSIRGYNRLLGLPLRKRPTEEAWCLQLQTWRHDIIVALGRQFNDLTLHDVQNCLCELDKYLRVKNGEGRPRSIYKPETAYGCS